MSVRTWDPREAEIFGPARCSEQGCSDMYDSICKRCNIAFCRKHLGAETPHTCVLHGERLYSAEENKPTNGKKKA